MEPISRRRSRRPDRRRGTPPVAAGVEALEARQLLAWTPLGFSLPDLSISGYAAPIAAYGEEIAVTVRVQNLGASSILEPLALEPGSLSTADAAGSTVGVYLSRFPRLGPGAMRIGEIDVPLIRQNSVVEITDTVRMPPSRPFLPASGEDVYLFFRADDRRIINDLDRTNNTTLRGVPVQIAPPLPELVGLAMDVPTVMQPGDVIAPTIKIANLGTANPDQQGPFQVWLVASSDEEFGPGDTVLANYTVTSIAPLALVPMPPKNVVLGDVNVEDPVNVLTLQATAPVTLPIGAEEYFLGVIVDPQNVIREITELDGGPDPALDPVVPVGPPIPGLPPAGVVVSPLPDPDAVFPFVPFEEDGRLPTLYEGLVDPPIIVVPVDGGVTFPGTGTTARPSTGGLRFRYDPTQAPTGNLGADAARSANAGAQALAAFLSGRRGSRSSLRRP